MLADANRAGGDNAEKNRTAWCDALGDEAGI